MMQTTTRPPLMSCSAVYSIHNCCYDERHSIYYNAPSLSMKGAGDEVEGAHCDKNDDEGTML